MDTVQDLPNLLYEVANESSGQQADVVQVPDGSTIDTPIGDSTDWQYGVIGVVKQYEEEKGLRGASCGDDVPVPDGRPARSQRPAVGHPVDWISPGFDDAPTPGNSRWHHDPPASDGAWPSASGIGQSRLWLRSTMQKRLPSGSASTMKSGSSG